MAERRGNDGWHPHYDKLFPRQERLDLGSPAAADGQAVDEGEQPMAVGAPPRHGDAPAAQAGNGDAGPGFKSSETWRRECEARFVMKLAMDQRRTYYAHVREKRGEGATRELIAEVNRQWKKANDL